MADSSLTSQIDAIATAQGTAYSVPDRNVVNDFSGLNGSGQLTTPPTPSSLSDQIDNVYNSQSSDSGSVQLPAGTGALEGNGIAAASFDSSSAAQNFNDTSNLQFGTNSPTESVLRVSPASPLTDADLQNPQTVFSNPFATVGGVSSPLNNSSTRSPSGADKYDRAKLRFIHGHPYASYPGILNPLVQTNGLVWPFKPIITVTNTVEYETMNLTHSIQEIHAFGTNKATTISVTGQFIIQNIDDALYALAAIHFLRVSSKMAFGLSGSSISATTGIPDVIPAGSPPPVLLFSGYGQSMFNDLPVIITSVPFTLPQDVDYISIPSGPGMGTKIPVMFSVDVSLTVQQSPVNMRNFNLGNYANAGQKSWW